MAGVNKVILVGNIGRDPELRYTPSGQAVANFTLATNEGWTDKNGQKQERTEWHRIVAWRKLGEFCGEYLSKGKQVYVEGRLQTRQWEDRNGKQRSTTEIIAQRIQMLGSPGETKQASAGLKEMEPPSAEETPIPASQGGEEEEDVPF